MSSGAKTDLLVQAISYVKHELSKKRLDTSLPATPDDVRYILLDAFGDLEHALTQVATGEWEVDRWGMMTKKDPIK